MPEVSLTLIHPAGRSVSVSKALESQKDSEKQKVEIEQVRKQLCINVSSELVKLQHNYSCFHSNCDHESDEHERSTLANYLQVVQK